MPEIAYVIVFYRLDGQLCRRSYPFRNQPGDAYMHAAARLAGTWLREQGATAESVQVMAGDVADHTRMELAQGAIMDAVQEELANA